MAREMIETRTVIKGTNRLLIATSILALAVLILVVLPCAASEHEQELQTKEIPSGFELNIAGSSCVIPAKTWTSKMKFKLGQKLLPHCMKLTDEYTLVCVSLALKLTPGVVECLDSIAKRYNEMSFLESTRSIEEARK